MNAQWLKEIRLVLPAWLAATLLPLAALLLFPREAGQSWAAFLTVLGVALVGSSAFGPEFSHGTMGQLLVQPCERRRVWLIKMGVLAAALAPFLVAMFVVSRAWQDEPSVALACFVPVCAFCATPALTLIARNGLGATVLTIALPLVLCGIAVAAVVKIYGPVDFPEGTGQFARTILRACFVLLTAYCVAACWLGYRMFMRFQVADTQTRALPLERLVEAPFAGMVNALFGRRQGAFVSLLRKELRLQHAAFLIAAGFAATFAVILVFLPSIHPDNQPVALVLPVVMAAGIIPLVMGALSVAEERSLGVHAWQLTLPVALWKQWLVKLVVTFGGSFCFGVVLPWLFLTAGHGRLHDLDSVLPGSLAPILLIVLGQTLFTALAMYASSLSFTTMRAIMGCIGLLTAIGVSISLLGKLVNETGLWNYAVSATYQNVPVGNFVGFHYPEEAIPLAVMAFLLLLLGRLAYGNFRHAQITPRRWWGQTVFLVVPVPILLVLLTLLGYYLRIRGDG